MLLNDNLIGESWAWNPTFWWKQRWVFIMFICFGCPQLLEAIFPQSCNYRQLEQFQAEKWSPQVDCQATAVKRLEKTQALMRIPPVSSSRCYYQMSYKATHEHGLETCWSRHNCDQTGKSPIWSFSFLSFLLLFCFTMCWWWLQKSLISSSSL